MPKKTIFPRAFGITNQDINEITFLFKASELKKGDYFTKTNQYYEKLSFVSSGSVRVFAIAKHKEITQWIATKWQFSPDLFSFNFKQPMCKIIYPSI